MHVQSHAVGVAAVQQVTHLSRGKLNARDRCASQVGLVPTQRLRAQNERRGGTCANLLGVRPSVLGVFGHGDGDSGSLDRRDHGGDDSLAQRFASRVNVQLTREERKAAAPKHTKDIVRADFNDVHRFPGELEDELREVSLTAKRVAQDVGSEIQGCGDPVRVQVGPRRKREQSMREQISEAQAASIAVRFGFGSYSSKLSPNRRSVPSASSWRTEGAPLAGQNT